MNTIRLAITPWIIGLDFCRTHLKIASRTLESPRFDLLRHLGFSDQECETTNHFCYGFGTLRNAKILHLRHRPLFACGYEVSPEARMRMAASVQSFVSGDTGMTAHIPASQSVERGAEMTLSAWRRGLKSLTLVFDAALIAKPKRLSATGSRQIKVTAHAPVKVFKGLTRSPTRSKTSSVLSMKKTSSSKRSAQKI